MSMGLFGGSAMTEYVTAAAAAERLGVSRITVWRWIRDGRFDGVRRKGLSKHSTNLIPVESVQKVANQLGYSPGDRVLER
jgi:excisionase family DNA binding protein